MKPFSYPLRLVPRRHKPRGYGNYRSYKPWLRDEFVFRCVYCLTCESWAESGHETFGVDHFRPISRYADLSCHYENLFYACNRCNRVKGARELGCAPDDQPYGEHLEVLPDGVIQARNGSAVGEMLIEKLILNFWRLRVAREKYISAWRIAEQSRNDPVVSEWFGRLFGWPQDMPDLTAVNVPSNENHGSEANCFARRNDRPQCVNDWFEELTNAACKDDAHFFENLPWKKTTG